MRSGTFIAAAAWVAIQLLAGNGRAQVVSPAPVFSHSATGHLDMTSLAAELDAIHAELAELRTYTTQEHPHGDGEHFCDCCYDPGWHAGAQLAVLRPNFGGGIFIGADRQITPDFDYEASARFVLGYRGLDGLGIRGRYWRFDHGAPPVGELAIGLNTSELDVQALDLELTKVFFTRRVHWDLGAGIRYAKVDSYRAESFALPSIAILDDEQVNFEGLGPTFAVEGRHQIRQTNLSLIGNFRLSLLHGDQKGSTWFGPPEDKELFPALVESGTFKNKVIPILETQFGIEWALPLRNGRLFVAALLEGQWWGDAVLGGHPGDREGPSQLPTENLGLFGGTLSVSYVW